MANVFTEEQVYQQKRERDYRRFFFLWMKRLIIGYVLGMTIFFIYLFAVQGLNIQWVGGVQRNYGKFLVKQNDKFITQMIEFEALTSQTGVVYSETDKAAIAANLEKQNEFLRTMQKLSPNEDNADYLDIYQDMLQIYAFYIQGEVMKAEYCYNYDNNHVLENEYTNNTTGLETYTIGQELCNMMGNMILNNFKDINQVRGTNYESKHNIIEMGNEMYPEVKDETNSSVIPGGNTNSNVGSEPDSSESTNNNDKAEDTNATE
jgi:hypothetical protein